MVEEIIKEIVDTARNMKDKTIDAIAIAASAVLFATCIPSMIPAGRRDSGYESPRRYFERTAEAGQVYQNNTFKPSLDDVIADSEGNK